MEPDPTLPDSPLLALLSITKNPAVVDMTPEQLFAKIQELRSVAQSAPTLSAVLTRDSETRKRRIKDPEAARKQQILDDL